jgi:DNA-binding NarL/FixJ family response regulator
LRRVPQSAYRDIAPASAVAAMATPNIFGFAEARVPMPCFGGDDRGDRSCAGADVQHNILIVDDHPIVQSALRLLFSPHARFRIVGTLDRGATVNAFLQSEPVDIVILDLNMPDARGVNVLADIIGARDMTVIILTGETQQAEIEYALRLGARGVVSKSDAPSEIIAACDAALSGEIYVSPGMKDAMGRKVEASVSLSSRQAAILHYLSQGQSSKEISYRLAIAQPTVSFHIAELRRKLGVTSNLKIIERAQELGLL